MEVKGRCSDIVGKESQLEQVRAYIYCIDFSCIINTLIRRHGWSRRHALTVCKMYRNFLFINRKYNDAAPPSEEVDVFWHQHILDTKKYHKDCMIIFGRYLHHYPYYGNDGKTSTKDLVSKFSDFQRRYSDEFNGEGLYQVRSKFSKLISYVKSAFFYLRHNRKVSKEVGAKMKRRTLLAPVLQMLAAILFLILAVVLIANLNRLFEFANNHLEPTLCVLILVVGVLAWVTKGTKN